MGARRKIDPILEPNPGTLSAARFRRTSVTVCQQQHNAKLARFSLHERSTGCVADQCEFEHFLSRSTHIHTAEPCEGLPTLCNPARLRAVECESLLSLFLKSNMTYAPGEARLKQ